MLLRSKNNAEKVGRVSEKIDRLSGKLGKTSGGKKIVTCSTRVTTRDNFNC